MSTGEVRQRNGMYLQLRNLIAILLRYLCFDPLKRLFLDTALQLHIGSVGDECGGRVADAWLRFDPRQSTRTRRR
jgi:hypothetical protein